MERLVISVFTPAQGGGNLELIDSDGNVKWRTNADSVKDLDLNFGEQGIYIGQNTGLKAAVSGSQIENAGVSVIFIGHFATQRPVDSTFTVAEQALQTT
jgi:hypothetical protein